MSKHKIKGKRTRMEHESKLTMINVGLLRRREAQSALLQSALCCRE